MYLHKRRMYIPNDVPALVSQFHFYNLLRHSFPLNKVKGLICGGDGGGEELPKLFYARESDFFNNSSN